MPRRLVLGALCFLVGCVASHGALLAQSAAVSESALKAGFGVMEITPVGPTPMAGYYGTRYSTGTHDPLWAKATVLDDGRERVVLITVDLISTTRWMVDETRQLILERYQVPFDHVLISASHSHTGPALYDPASRAVLKFGEDTEEAKQAMLRLPHKIADAVGAAIENLDSVTVMHGVGAEHQLAFNRRFFMTDGTVGWNPGKMNPRIVREAGPTDPTLPVIAFFGKGDKLRGLLCSFAIHLDTVGGTQWSADAPYTVEQSLQRSLGSDVHIQYATGACGDVNHLDVRSRSPQGGHTEAAKIGTRLAGAVLRHRAEWKGLLGTGLHATSETVVFEPATHTEERLAWAHQMIQRVIDKNPPNFMEMVEAFRIADVEALHGQPIEVEVQVISLGTEVAWVALPGEIFVQLGIAIKDGSPFATVSIHELANGSVGYVPTQQAYAQGNYEVVSARCGEGSGERLVASALRQLRTHFQKKISNGEQQNAK